MVMKRRDVIELANDVLIPEHNTLRAHLDWIDGWWHTDPEQINLPPRASKEHQDLRELSEDRWLALVVTTVAQQLALETIRSTRGAEAVERMWLPWQRNRMDSRQKAIHYSAIGYGFAYATVKPGDTGAVIRGR